MLTDQEYQVALARVEQLMDAQAGTPEAQELERLTVAIEEYEDAHFPIGA